MSRTDDDLHRLAQQVAHRRSQLHLSVDEAARRSRPTMSNATWHRLEDGKPVRDTTYARVDKVLDWPPRTCMAILEGAEPPLESETAGGIRITRLAVTADELRRAVQSAAIATAPDMTGAQIQRLAEEAVEELRRQGLMGSE